MPLSGGAYLGPKEIQYLFIDGGCLQQLISDVSETYFGGQQIDFDYSLFAQQFNKVFYYDALPPRKNNESDEEHEKRVNEKIDFFNHLRSINGYHVYEGVSRRRRKSVEQKEVDILIAVDLLTHTFRRNMHQVAFLTSDLDFRPLIEAIVREGMYIHLWYRKGKTNKELIYAADSRKPLTDQDVFDWCTANFRKQYQLPTASSQSGKNIDGLTLIETWTPEYGPVSEIYTDGNQYKLIFPSMHNLNNYTTVTYSDLELLKRYTCEVYKEFWKDPL
ncbi:MAG: NYN domain-containing protein [Microcoleaceae cyanobacterium]